MMHLRIRVLKLGEPRGGHWYIDMHRTAADGVVHDPQATFPGVLEYNFTGAWVPVEIVDGSELPPVGLSMLKAK